MALSATVADAQFRNTVGGTTISSVPASTAAAGRVLLGWFFSADANGAALYPGTIGGAAIVRQDLNTAAAIVASGTTASWVGTGATDVYLAGVYAIYGGANARPSISATDIDFTSIGSRSVTVPVTTGSTVIARAGNSTSTTAPTFTSGVASDTTFNDGSSQAFNLGHADQASGGTVTVTATGCDALEVYVFDTVGPPWALIGSTARTTAASGNLNLSAEPTGTQQDDLLLAQIVARGNAAFSLPAGGWAMAATQQLSGNTTVGAGGIASAMLAYVARGASTPASFNFTRTGGSDAAGRVLAWRCSTPGTPILDDGSSNTPGSNSSTVTTTALNGAGSGELLFALAAVGNTATSGSYVDVDCATQPAATNPIQSFEQVGSLAAFYSFFSGFTTASGSTGTITAQNNGASIRGTLMAALFRVYSGVAATLADGTYRTAVASSIASVPIGPAFTGRVVFDFGQGVPNSGASPPLAAMLPTFPHTIAGVDALRQNLTSGAAVINSGTTATFGWSLANVIEMFGVYSLSGNPNPRPAYAASAIGAGSPDPTTPQLVASTGSYTFLSAGNVRLQVRGGGASGNRRGRGGGAGAYAEVTLAVVPGDIIYWSIGAGGAGGVSGTTGNNGSDSWFRLNTNAAPTTTSQGSLAKGGVGGTTTTNGAGGTTAASIGTTKFAGGNGSNTGSGTTLRGGGGGSPSDAAAGGNASAGTGGAAGAGGTVITGQAGTAGVTSGNSTAATNGAGAGSTSAAAGLGGAGGDGVGYWTFTPTAPTSLSLDVPVSADNCIVALATNWNSTAPAFTSGVAQDYSISDGGVYRYTGGHINGPAAGTITVTANDCNLLEVYVFDTVGPPWSLIGVSAPQYATSGNLNLSAEPTGAQQDDILLAPVFSNGTATFTLPGGWSNAASPVTGNGFDITGAVLAYQIRGASPPGSYTFNRTGGGIAGGAIYAYRSSTAGAPSLDTSSSNTAGSPGETVTASGVSTSVANELVFAGTFMDFAATLDPSVNFGAATDPTQSVGIGSALASDGTFIPVATISMSVTGAAGSTGTFTSEGITADAGNKRSLLVALFKPFAGGGTTYFQTVTVGCATSVADQTTINKRITVACAGAVSVGKAIGKRVTVGCTGAVSAVKAVGKIIGVTSSSSTSVAASLTFTSIITVACSSAVSMTMSTGKLISAGCASSVSMLRSIGKLVTVACSGSVSIAAARSVVQTITVGCASTVTMTRAIAKQIAVTCASSTTAAGARATLQTITVGCSTAVAMTRQTGKLIAAGCASSVSMLRAVGKNVAVTCAGGVSVVKAISKSFAVACASSVTVQTVKTKLQTVTVTCSSAVTSTRQIGKQIAVGCSSTVAMVKAIGKQILVACSGAVSLSFANTAYVTVTVACSSAVSIGRSIAKQVAVSCSGAVSIIKRTAKTFAVSCATAVTGNRLVNKLISMTVSSTTTVGGVKVALVTIAVACSAAVSVSKAVGKRLAVGCAAGVGIAKRVGKSLAAACGSAVGLLKLVGKVVSVSGTTNVSIGKTLSLTLAINVAAVVSVGKSIAKTIQAGCAAVVQVVTSGGQLVVVIDIVCSTAVGVTKSIFKTLTVSVTTVVQAIAIKVKVFFRTLIYGRSSTAIVSSDSDEPVKIYGRSSTARIDGYPEARNEEEF